MTTTSVAPNLAYDFSQSPFLVAWEMTLACDLACLHCRAAANTRCAPGELSSAEGRRLIDELATYTPKPVLLMTGGDPLKRADLFDLIAYARSRGLIVGLTPATTTLLTRERIAEMKQAGLSRMAISLDGASPKTHDLFRGVDGSYELGVSALAYAHEIGLSTQVNTTVTRDTRPELPELASQVERYGVDLWSLFFLVPVGRGTNLKQLSAREYEQVLEWAYVASQQRRFHIKTTEAHHFRRVVLEQRKEHGGVDRSLVGLSLRRGPSGGEATPSSGTSDGNGFVFVSAQGDVAPSGFLPTVCGNVRTSTLLEVYRDSPLFVQLRDKDALKGKCGACEYKWVCGGSRARAWAESGDPMEADSRCSYIPPGWGTTHREKRAIGRISNDT